MVPAHFPSPALQRFWPSLHDPSCELRLCRPATANLSPDIRQLKQDWGPIQTVCDEDHISSQGRSPQVAHTPQDQSGLSKGLFARPGRRSFSHAFTLQVAALQVPLPEAFSVLTSPLVRCPSGSLSRTFQIQIFGGVRWWIPRHLKFENFCPTPNSGHTESHSQNKLNHSQRWSSSVKMNTLPLLLSKTLFTPLS